MWKQWNAVMHVLSLLKYDAALPELRQHTASYIIPRIDYKKRRSLRLTADYTYVMNRRGARIEPRQSKPTVIKTHTTRSLQWRAAVYYAGYFYSRTVQHIAQRFLTVENGDLPVPGLCVTSLNALRAT